MVSKLLLAVQENYFTAIEQGCPQAVSDRLAYYYYRVREGLGFNKTPAEYGAFPTDPYSHTPKHAGAQQPGMTGQVKEEILTRFGELGVRVADGIATFTPKLLRPREFLQEQRPFRYLDVDGDWHEITVPAGALAFTWCQVPVLYCPGDNQDTAISITAGDGTKTLVHGSSLSANQSAALFQRDGSIREVRIALPADILFDDARTGAQ